MPTTVTSSAGTVYHLWQLPELSAKEIETSIEFNELRNDLGNGYRSQVLYGSNTGVRSWTLRLPTLADTSVLPNTVTGVNGESVSREAYLWDLYCETRVTGQPFVYQCPRNGQYYIVDFKDKSLKYAKDAYIKLYGAGIELEQVRLDGETVLNPSHFPPTGVTFDEQFAWYDNSGHGASWANNNVSGNALTAAGDVVFSSNAQNGLNTVRLSGSASTGLLSNAWYGDPIAEIWLVMKMRESTFSNNAGVVTDNSAQSILVGTSGGTKFQNLIGASDEYYLNGVRYANTDMQAPMGSFGIVRVRVRTTSGYSIANMQVGKNKAVAGTFAKMDVAEFITYPELLSLADGRALEEHLFIKWGIS